MNRTIINSVATQSKNQLKLFGYDNFFKNFIELYNNSKLPNTILLSGKKGSGKATFAYHFINYLLSKNENNKYSLEKFEINPNNKSYHNLCNNIHPNFFSTESKLNDENIKIDDVRNIIKFLSKSTYSRDIKIILIDNVENLNINSLNALLKIIEEPNKNVFFILVHNDKKKIIDTLKSRCLIFKINLTFDQSINISNLLLKENIFELLNNDLINYYAKPGDFISLVNFSKENNVNLNELSLKKFLLFLIEENYYKKNNFIKLNIFNYIELYFLKIFNLSTDKNKISSFYTKFINKINYANKYNLDHESLFMEFKSKVLNG